MPNDSRSRSPRRLLGMLAGAAFLLVLLAAVLLGRALTVRSRQVAVAPAPAAAPVELDGAVDRLARGLRIATVSREEGSDPTALSALHDLLASLYPRVHASLGREVVGGHSLLYTWPGRDQAAAPVLLLGHLDVVPVEDESAWTHPPFAGEVADGWLWGRGTLDDKVNVFGLLEAAEALLDQGFVPERTVLFAFGHDEEIGGREGAVAIAALLAERGVAPEFVLDEGMVVVTGMMPGLDRPAALVGIAEKGYLSLALTAHATGGHSSMPPRETAVDVLARALVRLDEHPLPATLDGPVAAMLDYLVPEMSLGPRLVLANRWLTAPLVQRMLAGAPATDALLRTTTAPTQLAGSVKDNVLPTSARAVVNFRLHPRDRSEAVVAAVRRIVDDPRIEIEPTGFLSEPSPVSPSDGAGFRLLARTIGRVFPEAVVAPALVLGGTDSRHYAHLSRQVYRFTPITLDGSEIERVHGIDERLRIADYGRAIAFYARLLTDLGEL